MVNQLRTEVVGFVMHHLADAVPSEASTLWFLLISSFVQLACSLAVRMLYPSVWFWVCPRSRSLLQTVVPSYAAFYASLIG